MINNYKIPNNACIERQTAVIETQQQNPMKIGLAPLLISLTILVFNPMAAIAMIIKNLLNSFNGAVTVPGRLNTVVMTDANTKNKIKNGNIFLISNVLSLLSASRVLFISYAKVIGIIANVLVSFTIVA